MKWFHEKRAGVLGRNSQSTPPDVINDQMREARPLPIGRQEFEDWSDRIVAGSMLTADPLSLKFALADSIMHLGPTESHKPDAHFIHMLRKCAANQVAHEMRQEYKDKHTARVAAEEAERAARIAAPVTPIGDAPKT